MKIFLLPMAGMSMFLFLCIGPGTAAAEEIARERGVIDSVVDGLTTNSPDRGGSRFMLFGGEYNSLYGYRDERYRGEDKGDYLKTRAYYGGMEFFFTDFSSQGKSLSNLRMGLNANSMVKRTLSRRTLYAVPGHSIPEERVPEDEKDFRARFNLNLGFFIGIESRWIGITTGLTPKFSGYDEKEREKLDPSSTPSNPQYIKVSGRGYIWSDSTMRMNFRLRLGPEKSGYIVLNCYREDYNPEYGTVTSYIHIPLASFFSLRFGGYLYRSQSAYIEPGIKISSITLGIKGGSIINYQDQNITRASIRDGLFAAASVSYEW